MHTISDRLQTLRKALQIEIPVAHRITPEALGTGIPAGVNKENFRPDLSGSVDPVVLLLRSDLDFRTNSRNNPRATTLSLRQEHTASHVAMHGLNGGVQIAEYKSEMHFWGGYSLAGIDHSHGSWRIHAGAKRQCGSISGFTHFRIEIEDETVAAGPRQLTNEKFSGGI